MRWLLGGIVALGLLTAATRDAQAQVGVYVSPWTGARVSVGQPYYGGYAGNYYGWPGYGSAYGGLGYSNIYGGTIPGTTYYNSAYSGFGAPSFYNSGYYGTYVSPYTSYGYGVPAYGYSYSAWPGYYGYGYTYRRGLLGGFGLRRILGGWW